MLPMATNSDLVFFLFLRKEGKVDPPLKKARLEGHSTTTAVASPTVADVYFVVNAKQPPKNSPSASRQVVKVTPLEQQVVHFKRSVPPHVILFIACGYRMRLFGRDSRVASRRLGIMCIPGQPFENSSVPTVRVMHHAMRLVGMGYTVGIVEEAESMALRQEDGKKGLFERKLGLMMSRGTMVSENMRAVAHSISSSEGGDGVEASRDDDDQPMDESSAVTSTLLDDASDKFIFFLWEREVNVDVTAVSFIRGCCAYTGSFVSDALKTQITGIISAVNPVEVVANEGISDDTKRKLHSALGLNEGPTDDGVEDSCHTPFITLADAMPNTTVEENPSHEMAKRYLMQFNLTEPFLAFDRRHIGEIVPSMSTRSGTIVPPLSSSAAAPMRPMLLPGATIVNLEVLRCGADPSTSDGVRGTLLGHLNHCSTPFGFRQLRDWILHPMTDIEQIQRRQSAVAALAENADLRAKCTALFRPPLKDFEAVLVRLSMARCSVAEYIAMLSACMRVASTAMNNDWGPQCEELQTLFSRIASATLIDTLKSQLDGIHCDAEEPWQLYVSTDFKSLFKSAPALLRSLMRTRDEISDYLAKCLEDAKKIMKFPALEYKCVLQTPFLLEVPTEKEKLAPPSWTVVSRTKTATRFRNPEIDKLAVRLAANTERIKITGSETWKDVQRQDWLTQSAAPCHNLVRACVSSLAKLDAIIALSVHAKNPKYVRPKFTPPPGRNMIIKNVRHPMQSALTPLHEYVGNDVDFGCCDDTGGTWILTGPNMGGKSALMRSVALTSILAQMGSFVPADFAQLPIFTSIHTRMGLTDTLTSSTFLVEMQETAAILQSPDLASSLVLMDELGRGTSSYDGVAVADATLHYLAQSRATVMFVTHFPVLCRDWMDVAGRHASPHVQCKYMSFKKRSEKDNSIVLLYKAVDGVTPSSFGLCIAEAAALPPCVVDCARVRSAQCELDATALERLCAIQHFCKTETSSKQSS